MEHLFLPLIPGSHHPVPDFRSLFRHRRRRETALHLFRPLSRKTSFPLPDLTYALTLNLLYNIFLKKSIGGCGINRKLLFFQGKISFEVRPSAWKRTTFHGQILSAHKKRKQGKTVLIPGSLPSTRSLTGKTEQRNEKKFLVTAFLMLTIFM